MKHYLSLGIVGLALLAIAGCPASADDLCAKGTCDPVDAGDASTPLADASDDADGGIIVAPRDPCVDKPKAPECLSESGALFVDRNADAGNADGTKAHPFNSIAKAIAKVTNEKKRIYVCEGTYDEQISIETLPVTLIGAINCKFDADGARALIAPPTGIAVGIAKVGGASIVNVVIEGRSDPNEKGSSAIGLFVTRAEDLLIRSVDVTAMDASDGAFGADALLNFANGTANGANTASTSAGAPAPTCEQCKDGTTKSIAGQGGTATGSPLSTRGDAVPTNGVANNGGTGGATFCGPGTNGANGQVLTPTEAEGSVTTGKLTERAWDTASSAEDGKIGGPGQGGGGGGGNTNNNIGGGSGGCGGCGGGAGKAGGNGGSSIAVLVFDSKRVSFELSKVASGKGGNGGKGGDGGLGQAGADGGGGGCSGGNGGHGAGGNGGGGGAGGHSAAIAYVGEEPGVSADSTLSHATAGTKGPGGAAGGAVVSGANTGVEGKSGADGQAMDKLLLE